MSAKELDEAFKAFDHDGNGSISVKELGEVFKQLGMPQSDAEIAKLLKSCDSDKSGSLSKAEFKAIFDHKCDVDEMRKAFNAFDADGSGFITKDELKKAMEAMGDKLKDKDLNAMIAAADTDNDGKVGFEEFKKMMS